MRGGGCAWVRPRGTAHGMTDSPEIFKARQMAADIPGKTNPVEMEMMVRRVVIAGVQGCQLGLETVPGIIRVSIYDHGGDRQVPFASCVVDVVGGRAEDVEEAINSHKDAGLRVISMVRAATWRERLGEWCRWRWWKMFTDSR